MTVPRRCLLLLSAALPAVPARAASPPGSDSDLRRLPALAGGYDYARVLAHPDVRRPLRALLQEEGVALLERNLAVASPIEWDGRFLVLQGGAAHLFGQEEAILAVRIDERLADVGLMTAGRVTVYSHRTRRELAPQVAAWATERAAERERFAFRQIRLH